MLIMSYKGSVVPLYNEMEPLMLDQPRTIEPESSDNKIDRFALADILSKLENGDNKIDWFTLADILCEPESTDNEVDWFTLVHILTVFWVKFHKILLQILNVLLHHVKYHQSVCM